MQNSNFKQLAKRFYDAIWRKDISAKPWYQRSFLSALRIIYAVIYNLRDEQLSLRAMSLVYTTIISVVPLLALSFSVLKGFGVHNQIEPFLLNILEPLGSQRVVIVQQIIGFVDNIQIGLLSALGLLVLIYSAISMVQKIENSLNFIWQLRQGRSFMNRFRDYLSVILMGPLLIFLSIGLTATLKRHEVVIYLTSLPEAGWLIKCLGIILPYLILALAFTFIYTFMPNTKIKSFSAFIGGLSTAISWKLMGLLFAVFVSQSSTQTVIYSAFASAILFMLWLYLGWLLLLIGASIAFYHQNPNRQKCYIDPTKISQENQQKLLLTLSYLIAKRFDAGLDGYNQQELTKLLGLPEEMITKSIVALKKIGFLIETKEEPTRFSPAKPLTQISLYGVTKKTSQLDNNSLFDFKDSLNNPMVKQYLNKSQNLLEKNLANASYQALLDLDNRAKPFQ